ncbi:hypothetical protein [Rhodococcus sp. OK302]|uniref:hypothetical protein n=1 Tax=Rhodococcus sp. OK302 TaxID=1882769 RepID=UPI000B93B24F|nr:hypothetical protein [Rhodococcus sp. OK302]OYD69912.1 hypothetical protein BDB13_3496 [Rhodococcus sp. OK302]
MRLNRRSMFAAVIVCCTLTLTSCSSQGNPVASVGEAPSTTEVSDGLSQPSTPEAPQPGPTLVDPAAFAYSSGGLSGYFFTTPSGLWRCAILTFSAQRGSDAQMAGCQPKTSMDINVSGAPRVPDHGSGNPVAPNAILVNKTDDARFASLSQALFWRLDNATPTLAYGETLSTDGFSCNVQETGVSCRSDSSNHGFTFSTNGFDFNYTEALSLPNVPEPASATAGGPQPTLGRVTATYQEGYGAVRPATISNGGASLSGQVWDILWQSWGGEQVVGTGQSANAKFADTGPSPIEQATIVAFDLGDCEGTWMYRSFVWFFPSTGDTFESAKQHAINPCQDQAYPVTDPAPAATNAGSCGTVIAADGIPREVLIKSGKITCADAMTMMNATYSVLYDKPLDGMEYGSWNCGIVPAGEILVTCNYPNSNGSVAIFRSDDDPYR